MNKHVEAFNTLVNGFCCECRWTLGDKDCERYACLKKVNTLQELVEKVVIPKRPIELRTWTYDEIPYTALCPNCEENLGYEAKRLYKHYPNCGQALDWSEEDE